jgi:hypothetical protein
MYDSKYDSTMERVTVTIPKVTLAKIKQAAGPRGVSKFLTEAAKAHLARNDLQRWFDEMDAKYGKASPALVRKIDRDMRRIFGVP